MNLPKFSICHIGFPSIIMIMFEFLKKLFGWADEGSRKRRANDSFSYEKEYVLPKKQCCSHKTVHTEEEYFEIDDSDNDDVNFLTEKKYSKNSSNRLNGTHSKKCYSSYENLPSTSISKSPFSTTNCNKLNMLYFGNKENKVGKMNMDKCPTLVNSNQLKQKNQYGELLQNFLPHRKLNVMQNMSDERQPKQKCDKIVEIDKIIKSSSYKPQVKSNTSSPACCSRWSSTNTAKKENERIVPIINKNNAEDSLQSMPKEIEIIKVIKHPVVKPIQGSCIETITTNTLRDKLAAKFVTREDFVPQVAQRYNERIEQRNKEAKELKKMMCVLSKQNQLVLETALEERLTRSMRLCEVVLDETEEPEEPPLPTLTEEMLKEVKNAFVPKPPDEILIEAHGLRITRKDINTLADLNWLNDEVINFYMNLLINRGTSEKFPKIHAMNTFFYPKLISGGHSSLKRWTRKIDIFVQDIIVVPIHLGIHWCMSIIDFRDKSICYYDSMGSSNPKCLSALRQYLEEESMDKKKRSFDTSDWKLISAKNIPQQMNGSDCGVFSCMFAEYICANRKITFTQEDMPYFRNKMAYEILQNKLL
ncbi:PREDICTED: sentrin-specific protease 1-like [Polistes canadensis]|uniref:sentrin-specific protease 1-like n=1 Tax=Polistes canadensis TaxID=91411 RepID=UPI000718B4D0|nr:PREDICTED: sentrin-specific protease 1-like [Polistes canadensis]